MIRVLALGFANPERLGGYAGFRCLVSAKASLEGLGFRVLGLGFGVEGLGFRVWGLGSRVEGSEFKI
jgi:hypothetical protein